MAYTGTYKNKAATIIDKQALGYKVNRVFDPRTGSEFQRVVVQTVARPLVIDGKKTETPLKIKTTWLVPTKDEIRVTSTFNKIPENWHPNCNYKVGSKAELENGNLQVKVTPMHQPTVPHRHIEISAEALAAHTKQGVLAAEIVAKHAILKR